MISRLKRKFSDEIANRFEFERSQTRDSRITSICVFFRFNEDWLRNLVSVWLDLQSVARLDTAFTSKLLRQYWLDCIGNICSLSSWISVPENKIHDAVYWITSKTKKLAYINFSDYAHITNSCLLRISRKCSHLLALDLKHFTSLSDTVVTALGFGCVNLRVLHIEGPLVTDLGLQSLSEGCTELNEFYFNKCEKITDVGLNYLSKGCKKIQSIHLIGGQLITDVGLSSITRACNLLKFISIIKCVNISDITFFNLSNYCPLLEEFTFAGINNNITNAGISSLAHGCRCLRTFSFLSTYISGLGEISSDITDEAITDLVQLCHQLNSLSLYFCHRLSDHSLFMIAKYCKALCTLVFEDISLISSTGLSKVLESCKCLSTLKVTNCNQVNVDEFKTLRKFHKYVRVVHNDVDL